MSEPTLRVAVIVPCYNEEATIGGVVAAFRDALPHAEIYVYDNNSRDRTIAVAQAAGAQVRRETLQGKGNVVRRAFSDVEADIYVMVDGDGTYNAAAAPAMIAMMTAETLDMVTGVRISEEIEAYRPGHRFGNAMLTGVVRMIFGNRISDMLSGYRVFSRRFVKSFPAMAAGFETETEFTVHALELRMPVGELQTRYGSRPVGSVSKLNTIRDGIRILRTIMILVKEERPLAFFSVIGAILLVTAFALGIPVVLQFIATGLVPRFPTALLATGLALLSFLVFSAGLILDSVSHGRKEMKRLAYLANPAVPRRDAADA